MSEHDDSEQPIAWRLRDQQSHSTARGTDAFAAKWSKDLQQVTSRRAQRIKGPFDVKSEDLIRHWQTHASGRSPKIFGTPR
jgi:hypothetical protein